jgi:hypothetical protein
VNKYNSSFYNLLENYKSIVFKRRMHFPRNFNLSDDFIYSLKREISRLKKENLKDSQIVEKLSKALHFLIKN